MESNIQDPITIRRYLLCDLTDERLIDKVAQAMLCDDTYAKTVELVEQDLIEDFLEQKLSKTEQLGFEKRLANSSNLRQHVALVKGLKKRAFRPDAVAVTERKSLFSWHLFRSPTLRFATVLISLIVMAVAVWRLSFVKDNSEVAFGDLRRSVAGQRMTLGRSTLDSSYSPVITTRGPRPGIDQGSPEFKNARALLLTAEVKNPEDPKVLHRLGLLYLAEQNLDKALAEMLKAKKLNPDDADLLADIGAVYLETALRSRAEGSIEATTRDQILALEYTENSLGRQPDRIESLFNKALILEEMNLTTKATEAWVYYLEKDPTSHWASEARKRLESIDQKKPLSRSPREILSDFWAAYDAQDEERTWQIVSETKELISGSVVFFQLARKYAEASSADELARNLEGMRFIGQLEADRTPDRFFLELHRYYRDYGTKNREKLAVGAAKAESGYIAMSAANDWEGAHSAFEGAKKEYLAAGNRWEADIAEFQICYILTQKREIGVSSYRLSELVQASNAKQHYWIASLADSWQASNKSLSGDYSASIGFNDRALQGAKVNGDTLGVQKALTQLANQYTKLGNEERVLQLVGEVSATTPTYFQSPRQLSRNLLFASQGFHRFGHFAGAEAYADEHLTVASEILKDAWLTHSAHLNRANALSKLGKFEEANAEVENCFRVTESFPEGPTRNRLMLQSTLLRADIFREADRCSEGLSNYDNVIGGSTSTEFVASLYHARQGRLKCLSALKRDAEFVDEMASVLELFEKNRKLIEEESDRNIFFQGEQSVYDLGAEYAFSKLNDADLAFSYSERSRANSLLKQISGESPPPDLSLLQRKLPDGVSVLYFAVLPERTLVWIIGTDGWSVRSIDVSEKRLEEIVEEFSDSISRKAYSQEAAEYLYRLLLDPVSSSFSAKKLLCIIPDKSLSMLPFAALHSASSGTYLVEQVSLMYSPGFRVFNKISGAGGGNGVEHFVGIAATEFDRSENPGLDDIRDASTEVKQIAQKYKRSSTFAGRSATKAAFQSASNGGSILHFAGHYLVNRRTPSESKFLVADGGLTIDDLLIEGKNVPRLVVLSACESGIERYYSGEGMIGASRAFLAAGVPLVIGSRWAVDSAATAQLMIDFHEQRKSADLSSVDALRSAQIKMIGDPSERRREPFYWAGFMFVGGFSKV